MQLPSILSLLLTASASFASPIEERRAACSPVGISPAEASRVKASFTSSGIVPTLIPNIDPKVKLNAVYPSETVDLGNKFTTAQTITKPDISFSAEPGFDPATTKYTIFIVDPDVPGPNGLGTGVSVNFCHLNVADAQPSCIADQMRKTVALYEPLTPASPTQHRYTFLVYRQPEGYVPEPITPNLRAAFDLNGYVKRGGLMGPIGGNFLREAITNGVVT